MPDEPTQFQLKMLWPQRLLHAPPQADAPTGYRLRTHRPGDEGAFYQLMDRAGFKDWDDETLAPWLLKILPDGWYLIEHVASGTLVATAMANHNPQDLHPFGGELGWVAGHPDHAGRGLGRAVCAAVVRHLLHNGYRTLYLNPDDWRLPAISVYFQLGWAPFLYAQDMEERWGEVCRQLNQPFSPDLWPALSATD